MKLPTLDSNVSPANVQVPYVPGQMAQAASPNLDMAANAIAQYGRMQARDEEKVRIQEDKDARYWASIQGSELRKQTSDYVAKATENMPEGGQNFAGGIDEFIGSRATEIKKSAPNKLANDLWDVESANIRSQTFSHTIQTEAQERVRHKAVQISQAVATDAATLYQDGYKFYSGFDGGKMRGEASSFKILRDEKVALLTEANLPTQVREQIIKTMDKEYAQSYLYSYLNNEPKGLLESIKSGTMGDYLTKVGITPDQQMLQSFRSMAENIVKTTESNNNGEIRRYMENNLSSVSMKGEEIRAPFDEGTMRSMVGNDQWLAYKERLYVASEVFKGVDALTFDPSPENVKNVLGKYRKQANEMETARNVAVLKDLTQAWGQVAETIVKDGHAAAMQALKGAEVAMMVDGQVHYTSDPKGNFAGGVNNPTVARAAYSMEYQKRAGLPDEFIKVMSNDEANAHVKKLASIDPAAAEGYLLTLRQQYGPYYQKAFKQISQSGLPNGYKVALWASGTAMSDIVTNVARRSTKELEEASSLPTPELRNISESLRAELKPFVNTITFGDSAGTRVDYVNAMYDTMYKAVLAKVVSGSTTKEAINQVKQALITDRYYVKDTYWIPKTFTEQFSDGTSRKVPVNESTVENVLAGKKQSIAAFKPTNTNIFRAQGMLENGKTEILLEAIRKDSYWLVNEDGSGVYLAMTSNGMRGVPVVNSQKKRYEFKWYEVYREGPTAQGKIKRVEKK